MSKISDLARTQAETLAAQSDAQLRATHADMIKIMLNPAGAEFIEFAAQMAQEIAFEAKRRGISISQGRP